MLTAILGAIALVFIIVLLFALGIMLYAAVIVVEILFYIIAAPFLLIAWIFSLFI